MNEMEMKAKIDALVRDEEWVKKMEAAESAEEAAALLNEQGLAVTEDDLIKVAQMTNEQGELDETALDDVSGGIVFTATMGIATMVAVSVVAYGGAFAMSKFTASWNKKKKK